MQREPDRWNLARPGHAWSVLPSRALLHLFSPGNRLSILIYHRVLARPDPLFPEESAAESFDQQMSELSACFRIMSLRDAIQGLRKGTLPSRAACITFDDGYADNAEVALPIQQKHGICATFFIASGFLDGGRISNDTVIELLRRGPGSFRDRFPFGSPQGDSLFARATEIPFAGIKAGDGGCDERRDSH